MPRRLFRALRLVLCLVPWLAFAGPSLRDLHELVDTIAAYIHEGNYDAVFQIARSPHLTEVTGVRIETVATVLTAPQATKIRSAADFNRLLYRGSWFPFGQGSDFFRPFVEHLTNGDFVQRPGELIRIPRGLTYREGSSAERDLAEFPAMPRDRVQALKKILALTVFEELYHHLDSETDRATGKPVSPVMRRFLESNPRTFLTRTRRMENAVFIALYYEYGLLDSPELVRLFLQNHPRRDLLLPKGEWGDGVKAALERAAAAGELPGYRTSPQLLERLGLHLPVAAVRLSLDCPALYHNLGVTAAGR
jgi:hypothetical protein